MAKGSDFTESRAVTTTPLATRQSRVSGPTVDKDEANLNKAPGAKADWIIVALPVTLTIKTQYSNVPENLRPAVMGSFLFGLIILVSVAFLRPAPMRFTTNLGPLVMYLAASGIVVTRPDGIHNLITFVLVATLTLRIISTVEARRIISSLIDGIGLFCFSNVVAYLVGLKSPSEAMRINLNQEAAARIYFPLSSSVNLTPALAACYLASLYFVFREPGSTRRAFRILYAASTPVILLESGSRTPLAVAILLIATAIAAPRLIRIIPIVMVPVLFLSPLILRPMIAQFSSVISSFASAISSRDVRTDKVVELAGRGYIWDRAILYWREFVDSTQNILLGYGLHGHYKSGASHTYAGFMANTIRNTEKALHTHNSSLQQLFDGGLVGLTLLAGALWWCSLRLSKRFTSWGLHALAASAIMATILTCGMTEVFLSPDMNLYTFYVMMVIVGISCQVPPPDEMPSSSDRRQGA